jgi:hypothetical protein
LPVTEQLAAERQVTMQIEQQEQQFPRLRVFLRILLIVSSLVGTFFLIAVVLVKAMQQKEVSEKIRGFNKRTLNPLTLKVAGNRLRVYASVQHIGRHTGYVYTTPVVASPLGDGFVIPLPYGADVDWFRNVMAAGKCTLRWNGHKYSLEKPEVIASAEALGAFPLSEKIIFALGGIEQYVWLHEPKEEAEKEAPEKTSTPA